MSIVVPTCGENLLLDRMFKVALSVNEDYQLRLYSNDYTPVAASIASNFTEAAFTGYSQATMTRANWQSAVTDGTTGYGLSVYGTAVLTFTNTGTSPATVYGYYVLAATSGTLVYAERFATTRTLTQGQTLSIQPKFSLSSQS